MKLEEMILTTLKNEVVPVTGCTEPVAVTLCCAKAREILGEDVKSAEVFVSPNIYKNGLAVGVPHTGESGLDIASAMGLISGDSSKGLGILDFMEKDVLKKAKVFLSEGRLGLNIEDTKEKIYIRVNLKGEKSTSTVIIKGKHDNIAYVEKDKIILKDSKDDNSSGNNSCSKEIYTYNIKDIVESIEKIPHSELAFMLDGLLMNEKIANYGLKNPLGMEVGFTLQSYVKNGILASDLMNDAKILTAAASDARMSGANLPVMSSNGSGNNGLTAILPIVAYKNKFKTDDERLAKALAMSHIINSYVKHYIGRLSALCGCGVAAGTGAGVAITWLMGGKAKEIEGTIKNIIADISGMICDGAKIGCALKLSTSASVAIQGALLSLAGKVAPDDNGIVSDTAEESIKNLRDVAVIGMEKADSVIIKAMQRKAPKMANF
ncbi:L-cysteine desulfidase [Acetoanaerobium pronyense]|uniref:UPF0597 protein J2Z35_002152 n=1 Tax=Acetoanaerobium pronyense TaxID=1482736 RepID=A0ABS4KMG9_9FIRM|nr:L-serine ammonia-lyase, iron-sulfur-dependent, subunit alpha [Acetoanaerobium pronyense]MBP2028351.1 L-cysteine desulfidase [Acetoanaerobium pronyense]